MASSALIAGLLLAGCGDGGRSETASSGSEAPKKQMFDEFIGGPLTNCFCAYGPTGADPLNNRAFPDFNAVYWAAAFVRPEGSKVEMEGYPADWRGAYDPDYNKDAFAPAPLDYLADPSLPTPPKVGGSYYPNVFNTYLRTFINRNIGKVVVIRFKPWPAVKTYRRDPVFEDAGADMRFWSISLSESQATTRVMSGLFDEQFPVNPDGYITFVASSAEDRPATATAECGVGWVDWKTAGDGVGNPAFGWLSIRNMLPKPGTTDNLFALQRPGDEQAVLGEHYPELRYFGDAAAFDALGCGGGASAKATAGIPAKNSPDAIGWPYSFR